MDLLIFASFLVHLSHMEDELFRAFVAVELNKYNAILVPPKYQKGPCSSGGIGIIFS